MTIGIGFSFRRMTLNEESNTSIVNILLIISFLYNSFDSRKKILESIFQSVHNKLSVISTSIFYIRNTIFHATI